MIVCDNSRPNGKNHILEHPKIVERYRHVTEVPSSTRSRTTMFCTKGDREIVELKPPPPENHAVDTSVDD